jgi:hypothetical protein
LSPRRRTPRPNHRITSHASPAPREARAAGDGPRARRARRARRRSVQRSSSGDSFRASEGWVRDSSAGAATGTAASQPSKSNPVAGRCKTPGIVPAGSCCAQGPADDRA